MYCNIIDLLTKIFRQKYKLNTHHPHIPINSCRLELSPMTTYLDELPIELEEAVSRYLDIESLSQFRLVNKHFDEISLPAFRNHFQEVKATWSAAGINKLLAVSKSPLL